MNWFYESYTREGKTHHQIKTSIIIWFGVLALLIGVIGTVLHMEIWNTIWVHLFPNSTPVDVILFFGLFLSITVFPCCLLYPLIREVFFKGEDSWSALIWTYIIKNWLQSLAMKEKNTKKRKY